MSHHEQKGDLEVGTCVVLKEEYRKQVKELYDNDLFSDGKRSVAKSAIIGVKLMIKHIRDGGYSVTEYDHQERPLYSLLWLPAHWLEDATFLSEGEFLSML